MYNNKLQTFALPEYCNATAAVAASAGKDIMLCIWNEAGTDLLAIAGQQSLTLNRGAEAIEVNTKDTGGWKSSISGLKEWSADTEGLYVASDESHKELGGAFENGDPVCIVVKNIKTNVNMFGGLAYITDYSLEAPYDDAMTYSISLSGAGPLNDLSEDDTFAVTPASWTAVKPSSGSVTKAVALENAVGNVTGACSTSGVSVVVSGNVAIVSVASSTSASSAVVTFTDGEGNSCDLDVTIE